MNPKLTLLALGILTLMAPVNQLRAEEKKPEAGEKPSSSKVEAGPRKGRILAVGEPKAEFFVEADKTISIKFYDKENKVIAPAAQVVTATVDLKGTKTKVEFEKKGDALVSKTKVADIDGAPIVVQVKTTAEAKPQNFRFKVQLHTCKGCTNPEYACTCDE